MFKTGFLKRVCFIEQESARCFASTTGPEENIMIAGNLIRLEKEESEAASSGRRIFYQNRKKEPSRVEEDLHNSLVELEQSKTAALNLLEDLRLEIEERKAAEEALIESEKNYRQVVNSMHETLTVINGDGDFLFLNEKAAESLSGGIPDDLVGRNIRDFVPPEQAGRLIVTYKNVISTNQPLQQEIMVSLAGGDRWFRNFLQPIRFGSEKTHAVLSISLDITEEIKAKDEKALLEEEYRQSQKMESVGRLAGGVAHDFNNMLGITIGYAEMALMSLKPSDPLYAIIREIMDAGRRSSDLVRQLLSFARKQTIDPRVLDLNETIAGMLNMLKKMIGENIELVWLPAAKPLRIKMDPTQIDQIMVNLAINARDSIGGIGKIIIETDAAEPDEYHRGGNSDSAEGEYVLLSVRDNGCGMNKETARQIFEPFFTTKEMGKGTGLGLSTVYGIVKQNNGLINFDSSPGEGTIFQIYLPRHKDEGMIIEDTQTNTGIPKGRETVLVVEDEESLLEMVNIMFEELGYSVLTTCRPLDAIQLAAEHPEPIDLLVTDVVMPEMNGNDLAKRIRDIWPGIKCLFISGYPANVIVNHGVLDEGICFLKKPFLMKDLALKVREVLETGSEIQSAGGA